MNAKAGVDTGDMPVEDVAAMFGKTEGFKASDPVITPKADEEDEMVDAKITVDDMLGLYRCDMTVDLPPISVTKWKNHEMTSDMRCSEVNEIVDELIEKALED